MSRKTSKLEPVIRRLERQAAELMHKDTDLITVVTEFAFTDTPVSGTAANEWEAKYGYRPMVCAFYCKELAGFTTTGLSEYLTDAERACARTLGVDEILGQFCSRGSREFLAVERLHHRTIPVLSVPFACSRARNGCIAERQSADNGQEIGVFVYQFGSLAFEPPDGRLELGCLL